MAPKGDADLPFRDEADCGQDHHLSIKSGSDEFQIICAGANFIYSGIKPLEPRYSSWSDEVTMSEFKSLEEDAPTPESRLRQPKMWVLIIFLLITMFQMIAMTLGSFNRPISPDSKRESL